MASLARVPTPVSVAQQGQAPRRVILPVGPRYAMKMITYCLSWGCACVWNHWIFRHAACIFTPTSRGTRGRDIWHEQAIAAHIFDAYGYKWKLFRS